MEASSYKEIKVNNNTVATANAFYDAWMYAGDNFIPLKENDIVTIESIGVVNKASLIPCNFVTEQLLVTPVTVSNELDEEQSPLEKLLIKGYYPLTEEQIKEALKFLLK